MQNNVLEHSIWYPFNLGDKQLPVVKKASGIYLELGDGTKVMDCISSWWVNIHGHCNRYLVDAMEKQARMIDQIVFADFSHDPAITLAENLLSILPKNMHKVYFTDDGSTSVELALKLAFQYWQNLGFDKKNKFITFEDGYHGDTLGSMSVGSSSVFTQKFKPLMFDTIMVKYPRVFYDSSENNIDENMVLSDIENILSNQNENIAGLIIEPLVQGAGGMNMCSNDFLSKLANLCKKYDIFLIFDEVMTGFGRTGEFFAALKCKVEPDIICLSKAITGGFMPLAATVMNKKIFECFNSDDNSKRFFHGHSYTANSIACAVANASFDLLLNNQNQFRNMQDWHIENYNKYFCKNEFINKFRVCGTIAAFDINHSGFNEYGNNLSQRFKSMMLESGFLLRPLGSTVYILTPYCITKSELEEIYISCDLKINELINSM